MIEELALATADLHLAILCGFVSPAPAGAGRHVQNSAALLRYGRVDFVQSKTLLPFYDVFDEQRYFEPAARQQVVEIAGERVAVTICEDAWNDKSFWETRRYSLDPVEELMKQGASLIVNISASPYWRDKRATRVEMLGAIARRYGVPVVMVNQVGGNDSLIFDGSSVALDAAGVVVAQARTCAADLVLFDTSAAAAPVSVQEEPGEEEATTYRALVLGARDYVRKCGFSRALVGLSGGIDSALVTAIAVDALGAGNVTAIGMPSPYSSAEPRHSLRDPADQLHV